MNIFKLPLLLTRLFWPFLLLACMAGNDTTADFTVYVDPFIGSGGHGHVFVGASVPFGAVQLGPNNIYKGWDWCSGYHASDSIVIGFSHTHLSGTGCSDLGDVLIMPANGEVFTQRGEQDNINNAYASLYRHENETAVPGYYGTLLDKYNIKVELTATERVGMHRYSFPESSPENHIIIDLKEGNGDRAYETYLRQVDEHTVEGYRFSRGWTPEQHLYFTLQSNQTIQLQVFDDNTLKPGTELRAAGVKGVLTFGNPAGEVMLKVGLSPVSCTNALGNIKHEIPGWDFDSVVQQAHDKWNRELAKVVLETSDEDAKRIFYTAMYHTFIAPTLFNDYNRDFRGHDKKIYAESNYNNYSTFSLWDTYRTQSQWLILSQPQRINDMVNSMIGIFEQQGKLPVWPLAGDETNCMPGYSAVPVIADAYLKGFTGFDAEKAFEALKVSSTYPRQKGVPFVMTRGYIPADSVHEATSIAMEYAVDDWSIAQMAKRMGKTGDYEYYHNRSTYYKRYFDREMKFIRPVMSDGTWRTPYSPIRSVHGRGDFCEGNGWQYTFFAPQDPEGLISLFGGDKPFLAKLDSLFLVTGDMGPEASADISGLIGQYAHGNEPSHHVVYLYAYAGQQWKTAEKVRYILDEFYKATPDGLIGNEDCGQMSSWYILSSMGFYPVSPSGGIYVFGSPRFSKVSLDLSNGKKFIIEARNNSAENIYIQQVKLNGRAYDRSFLSHADLMAGGRLEFIMGNKPNYDFGTAPDQRPMSIQ